MYSHTLLMTLGLSLGWQEITPAKPEPVRDVEIVRSAAIPVALESARHVLRDDGIRIVEAHLINSLHEPLTRAEVTVLVYDVEGRRRGVAVSELSADDLPVESKEKRTLQVPLTSIVLESNDYVAVALTTVASQVNSWSYARFGEDADKAFIVPDLIMLSPEDAPIRLSDMRLTRGSTGAPALLNYVVKNKGDAAVSDVTVHWFLFDSKRTLRAQRVRNFAVPIPGNASVPIAERVHHMSATASWKVVVAVGKGTTADRNWVNPEIEEQARQSLLPKPKWRN